MSEMKNTRFSLRNQEDELTGFTENDILDYLEALYDDWNQFIVLSAEDKPIDGIYFLQAFWDNDVLHMEIGVEIKDSRKVKMYESNMSMQEGEKLFMDFFHGKWTGDMSKFTLCECQP